MERMTAAQVRALTEKKVPDLLEKEIRAQVKEYLTMMGWFVFYILQGTGSYKGIPDLIAVKDGRVVFIELKTRKGKQSAHQVKFQADVEAHGGEYRIVRSLDDAMAL